MVQRKPRSLPVGTATSARLDGWTFNVDGLRGAVFVVSPPEPRLPPGVPGAEREVATLLLAGRSIDEIAVLRGRSRFTTMNQVQSLYRRLGVGSCAELARRFG